MRPVVAVVPVPRVLADGRLVDRGAPQVDKLDGAAEGRVLSSGRGHDGAVDREGGEAHADGQGDEGGGNALEGDGQARSQGAGRGHHGRNGPPVGVGQADRRVEPEGKARPEPCSKGEFEARP